VWKRAFATGAVDRTARIGSEHSVQVLPARGARGRVDRVALRPAGTPLTAVHDDQSGAMWASTGDPRPLAGFEASTASRMGIPGWRDASLAFLDAQRFLVDSQDAGGTMTDCSGERSTVPVADAGQPFEPGASALLDIALHPRGVHFAAGPLARAGAGARARRHDRRARRAHASPNGRGRRPLARRRSPRQRVGG
jgi:hypothetical protein